MFEDRTLRFENCLWVSNDPKINMDILKEAHTSKLSIHLILVARYET